MTLYKKINEYFNTIFYTPDSSIYHYTKSGVGLKIIESEHFKLSPHKELNKKEDNGELIIGPALATKYLKKVNLGTLESKFKKFIENGIDLFIGSFSELDNNQYALEKYGPDCLKLETICLKNLTTQYRCLIGSVIYNNKLHNEIISTVFDLYKESSDEDETEKRCALFIWLLTISPLLKAEKHCRDVECRIITISGKDSQNLSKVLIPINNKITFSPNDIELISR